MQDSYPRAVFGEPIFNSNAMKHSVRTLCIDQNCSILLRPRHHSFSVFPSCFLPKAESHPPVRQSERSSAQPCICTAHTQPAGHDVRFLKHRLDRIVYRQSPHVDVRHPTHALPVTARDTTSSTELLKPPAIPSCVINKPFNGRLRGYGRHSTFVFDMWFNERGHCTVASALNQRGGVHLLTSCKMSSAKDLII